MLSRLWIEKKQSPELIDSVDKTGLFSWSQIRCTRIAAKVSTKKKRYCVALGHLYRIIEGIVEK